MIRIAILGANGQVGTEVSLFLQATGGVEPIAIVRSELGAALLRRLGVACRIGALAKADEASSLLEGCDLVADFSLPGGLPSRARAATRTNILNALRFAPGGVGYALASSTMAVGMVTEATRYESKTIARTLYARQKRHAERVARLLGRVMGRPVYVMRLGQVHGELQSVSRHYRSLIDGRPIILRGRASALTDTLFTATLASALVVMAQRRVGPGTYSLVEEPDWSMKQLIDLYAEQSRLRLRDRRA